jgi:SSS family solute:Na+ symporter
LFARNYQNIMTYLQTLFGFFNAPLFATFILGMFWKRMTATAGWTGLVSGTAAAVLVGILSKDALGGLSTGVLDLKSQGAAFAAAGAAFVVDIVVSVAVTMVSQPKPESELRGLVWSMTPRSDFHDADEGSLAWWQKPNQLAAVAGVMVIALNIIFW